MSNLTRIKNNQITDSSIFANTKIAPGTIVGSLFSSNLVIATDITISGNLTVQGTSHTGIVYANAGIASTSTTTGAIVVTGGLGVSGNIYAGSIISAPTVSATSLTLGTALAIGSGGTNSTATPTAGGIGYGTGTAHAYTAVGTSGQVLTSAGTGVPTWTTPATSYTTTQTFTGSTSVLGVILNNAAETTNVVASALTGVVPIYLNLGAVQYYTAAATAAWTPNISLSSLPTTLNNSLAIGQSTTVAIMATQGTTAYFSNALQIDSTAVTMKWKGGSAPTAGNISGIDVYTYTITKTAASTYIVLASFTQFK